MAVSLWRPSPYLIKVPVPDLGMPISFWTSVCVMKTIYSLWLDLDIMSLWSKTMYVAIVLYGYLSQWCSKNIYVAGDA